MIFASQPAAMERDLRLDFFRGLALFCIFLDHVPNNILAEFTLQSVMFADAAEIFILISGYTVGMVYGRAMERQGFLVAGIRVYHRVWQLYVAHVFLFMVFMAMVSYTEGALNKSLYAEEFGATNFLNEPGLALVQALILQFQPAFMDILPLYIVLLAILPLVLAVFRSWPAAVYLASFALWLAVQLDHRIALSAYPGPDQVWFLNPFAWQALFLLGAWFGWRNIRGGVSWLSHRWLLWLAAALSLMALLIRFNWTLHGLYDPIPVLVSGKLLWPFLSKTDLGFLRLVNMLAIALLVARLIRPQARFLASSAAWPFLVCGRNSLYIFCLGILLSVLGHLVLNEFFGGLAMQFAVSVAGVVIMIAVAALLEWFVAAQGTPGGGRRRGAVGEQRSARMISAFFRSMGLIAALVIGSLPAVTSTFAQERECPVPERSYTSEPPLVKTAKALAGRREAVIAVLGGASTLGVAAGGPEFAWPARLASALAEKVPSARTKVINLAVGRQTAKRGAERLDARCPLPEADARNLGDRHDGGRSRDRR